MKEGLVPVIIGNDGTVTKTETDDINWYDYNESKWANAVILTGTDTYGVGQTIPESAIESYFVWIPKYRYKLFNVEGNSIPAQEIEVEIGDYDTVNSDTECIATNKSGDIGTCENGKWMTHPAFTSLGVNGIWVGKFETGYKGSTDKASAEKNENAPEKVQIKPNVNSWRYISVSNAYNTSFNYRRSLDSHMMKNTEWGAFVYLTNSKYGRPKDENGVPTEVWINNNSQYVTGCVGNTKSEESFDGCQKTYNSAVGYHGSTTDNISGIYDTSGGAWDTVVGNYNNVPLNSAFTENEITNIADRYINRYFRSDITYKILGDATFETHGWNQDCTFFVNSSYPWFVRGGYYNHTTNAGVFSFNRDNGGAAGYNSFRIVLSPTN